MNNLASMRNYSVGVREAKLDVSVKLLNAIST